MNKKWIKKIIKSMGMLSMAERLNFYLIKRKFSIANTKFRKENPHVILPPDFHMYETFSLDYRKFYFDGMITAQWLVDHFTRHKEIKNANVLDWGCGSGRVLRHFPSLIAPSNTVFGSDFNEKYVNWCQSNLKNVKVKQNDLLPPLKFEDGFFNFIYGISIFTHLSAEMHQNWMAELSRVSNKGAIVFFTLHGTCFKTKLSVREQKDFDDGQLIEHFYKVEGNRLFEAYQSPIYFKELALSNGFEILEHKEGELVNSKPQQDVWILKKK